MKKTKPEKFKKKHFKDADKCWFSDNPFNVEIDNKEIEYSINQEQF